MRNFFEYMKRNDRKYFLVLFGVFIVIIALMNIYSYTENKRSAQVKAYTEKMKIYQEANQVKNEYERNKKAIEDGLLKRALAQDKIETYQSRLMQMLQEKNIHIQNITALKTPNQNTTKKEEGENGESQKGTYIEYEATCLGQWNDILDALKVLESEPVAINFRSIKMEVGEDERIKALIRYKIYVLN